MDGKQMAKIKTGLETIVLTPSRASELLEHNKINRPIIDSHVARLDRQIVLGKWRFNGDTIKISDDGDVLDGLVDRFLRRIARDPEANNRLVFRCAGRLLLGADEYRHPGPQLPVLHDDRGHPG